MRFITPQSRGGGPFFGNSMDNNRENQAIESKEVNIKGPWAELSFKFAIEHVSISNEANLVKMHDRDKNCTAKQWQTWHTRVPGLQL